MKRNSFQIILNKLYLITILLGGLISFSYLLKRGDLLNSRNKCENAKIINNVACKTSQTANLIFKELNNVKNLFPGRRLEYVQGFNQYKNEISGFEFNYPKNSEAVKGFLLLSRYHPDTLNPAIELWDLNKQKLIHFWNINLEELSSEMTSEDRSRLRLKHPLLLKDGSLITTPTINNAPVLKYNKCGYLINKNEDYGYHHSIEIDESGLVYIPVDNSKVKSIFYKNYKSFRGKKEFGKERIYRDEAISILDKDLNLKEIIPLDEIFYSVGLLHDANSSLIDDWADPYHLNDIHPFTNKKGEKILYLSMRNYGLMSFNQTKNKVEWVMRGVADLQHDITPVPNKKNTISIFDNGVEKNTPLGSFRGNSLIEIEFPQSNNTKYYLGRKLEDQGLSQKRINFSNLPLNLIPNSTTQGRGRFLENGNLFIEATNQGKIFEYDPVNKKVLWTYLNKGKSGKIYMLSWSRYYEELPKGLSINDFDSCKYK